MALYEKINSVIDRMDSVARENSMIALNASISSNKLKGRDCETMVFGVLSGEMKKLTDITLTEIKNLESILEEVKNLSKIVNLSGSLRMLSQKYMKLCVLLALTQDSVYSTEKDEVDLLFITRLKALSKSPYNDAKIALLITEINSDWQNFTSHVRSNSKEIKELVVENNEVLEKIQKLVNGYELISG